MKYAGKTSVVQNYFCLVYLSISVPYYICIKFKLTFTQYLTAVWQLMYKLFCLIVLIWRIPLILTFRKVYHRAGYSLVFVLVRLHETGGSSIATPFCVNLHVFWPAPTKIAAVDIIKFYNAKHTTRHEFC